jgi:TctA family transporter
LSVFVTRPISGTLLVLAICLLAWAAYSMRERREP